MNTAEVNANRLETFTGPAARSLVDTVREILVERDRLRIVAIGRSANGGAFKVVAPPDDFAEAVAKFDGRRQYSARLSDEALAKIENEQIGAEIGRRPFEW